ncbi:MAG: OmpA family protein [Prevotellaceae bacterium]|jgi:outer membrane protein OmpA-like peptidoglycan-associated protein/tetratricopeptide (TPR) repeat protein|nr:OmpA family protein [Prevotellaceae bacterium]
MKTLKYLIIIFALSFFTQLSAQNINFTTDNFIGREAALEQALKALHEGDGYYAQAKNICPSLASACITDVSSFYNQALSSYLAAQNINSNNASLNYRIGECYIYIEKNKAIPYLEKALSLDERTNANAYLFMGIAYQYQGMFTEAITYYQKYKTKLTIEQFNEYGSFVDRLITECQNAPALINAPVRVFVDNYGKAINSAASEFHPVVSAGEDQIYFNRTENNSNRITLLSKNGQSYDTTYITIPKTVPLTTLLYLSDDRNYLLFSSSKKNKTDLFETYQEGGKWTKPKALKRPVKSKYNENSAYLSPNGAVLFFSSNRPGGYGGVDIYMARRNEKGKWEKTILNLGAGVNTRYNEHISFVSADGNTIYFTSEGHNSIGGSDIFKSEYNTATNTWSEAVNVGYPINSISDETFFYPLPGNQVFYLSSSREGGFGGQDIYRVNVMKAERNIISTYEDNMLAYHSPRFLEYIIEPIVQIRSSMVVTISGMVVDKASQQPVQAKISIVDNSKGKVVAEFESNSETGRFTATVPEGANYGMTITATGYMFQSENIDIPYGSKKEHSRFIELAYLDVNTTITLRNIFFDFGSAQPTPSSKYELEQLYKMLASQPTVKIEISGHTDNRGSEEANMRLSNLRAKSVVDYLVKAGIDPERLSYIGYGLKKPIATNVTAEGRRMNRRTDIRIISR